MLNKFLTAGLFSVTLAGCASINSVSLTPVPSQRGKVVSAQASKTVFLAFSFDNDFIDTLVPDLQKQCPGGLVSGILTKDEVISYVIVFTHRVTATGFCNSSIAQSKTLPGPAIATLDGELP